MAVATQDGTKRGKSGAVDYVRTAAVEAMPAPGVTTGAVGWVRANLFSSPANIALTLISVLLVYWIVPPFIEFMITHAVWTGADREACLPTAERWRVDIFFVMLAIGIVWLLWLEAPRRDLGAVYFFVVVPIVSYVLLN